MKRGGFQWRGVRANAESKREQTDNFLTSYYTGMPD